MNTKACTLCAVISVVIGLVAVLLGAGRAPADADAPERAAVASTEEAVAEVGGAVFFAVDVYIEAGASALGAYQVLIEPAADAHASLKVVGVEGSDPTHDGGSAAYAEPPFYDPAAMMRERVVIAALSTRAKGELPSGRVRVARVHYMLEEAAIDADGDAAALLCAELQAAGDERGERIGGARVAIEAISVGRSDGNGNRADQADQGDTP